jgi:competence protein ComEA
MPDLVRPEPPPSWRDRAAALIDAARRPWAVAGAAGAVVLVGLLAWLLLQPATPAPGGRAGADPALALPRATTTTAAPMTVHVAGAVLHPGLVRLAAGARVADAIAAAGGPAGEADLDRLNLAAPLTDGSRLYVPFLGRPVPADETSIAGPTGRGAPAVVDLNTATVADLESLPGIGPATARAIVEHRRRYGPFRSVDDLLAVRGIGPAKLAQLRDRVRV